MKGAAVARLTVGKRDFSLSRDAPIPGKNAMKPTIDQVTEALGRVAMAPVSA